MSEHYPMTEARRNALGAAAAFARVFADEAARALGHEPVDAAQGAAEALKHALETLEDTQ